MKKFIFYCIVLLVFCTGVQAQERGRLLDIIVTGNARLTDGSIVAYTGLTRGASFDEETVPTVLQKLYETGLFDDIQVTIDENILLIRVAENPVVRRIAFVGYDDIDEERLQEVVGLKARDVYNKNVLQGAVDRLLQLYRSQGFYAAKITPQRINLNQNRVDLEFVIEEGNAASIDTIQFIGNKNFSDDRLKEVIFDREARWYRFFSSNDIYDPERVKFDQELLRRFYLEEGYLDFRVTSSVAELTTDRQDFIITFVVEEGERYEINDIIIENELPELRGVDFADDLDHSPGDWYRTSEVDESIRYMIDHAKEAGYGFVNIDPRTEPVPNEDGEALVNIIYEFRESGRKFVERINITGNERTVEEVIRREILIGEGDVLNAELARRSRERLQVMGIFSNVEISSRPSDDPDKEIIDIEVEEARTGEFSVSAGYSSTDGFLTNVQVSERNFLGRNQNLNFGFIYSDRRESYQIGFNEPYFLGKNLSLGTNLYHTVYDYQSESGYKRRVFGGSIYTGYRLFGDVRQTWSYIYERSKIFALTSRASDSIRRQQGSRNKSSIKQTLSIDKRDSFRRPTKGYYISGSAELAGVGGNVRFARFSSVISLYYNFDPSWVTALSLRAGHVLGYDSKTVDVQDRFYLGGDDLRGFDFYGVGPRDSRTRSSLGGNSFYSAQFEQSFPIGLPPEVGIEGRAFVDVGSLFKTDDNSPTVDDSHKIRVSAGLGIAWDSPLGPLRFYYAFPIRKGRLDETRRFLFTVGATF